MAKKWGFILKLDLSKAYDWVDWSFLMKVLLAFGFSNKCVDLFKQLISFASFVVLVNGSPSPFFKVSEGLRQGDPISPILFIIMVECFGRYMESMVTRGIFKGLQPSSIDHTYSHQQFVDDTIIMGDSSISVAKIPKDTLCNFASASGQLINWVKSEVFFINTPKRRQHKISRIMECRIVDLLATYLGLPLGIAPPDSFWSSLVDKFQRKLVGWKGALLSQAGKLQLLKASLQSIPSKHSYLCS